MQVAIIENDKVVNVIIADSLENAKEITGASEVIDAVANNAFMNFIRVNGVWYPPAEDEPTA